MFKNAKIQLFQVDDFSLYLSVGQKYVWSGGLRNIKCPSERFQPPGFNLWQNVSSQCIFLKSFCNEEGQVIHINGSAEKDVSCRCDHTRGYAFVANNNTDKSSCKSLEEDCSCYTKKCLFKETLAKGKENYYIYNYTLFYEITHRTLPTNCIAFRHFSK